MGYLRPHQVDEFQNEKRVIERTLTSRNDVQDRGNLEQHMNRIDRQLAEQAPPESTGEDRDRMIRECGEIEERLVPEMPSDEAMRKNPPGTVGKHMRFEKLAKNRDRYDEGELARWKDNQLTLNRGSDDPDVANFERMRPLSSNASMLGAQIPGTQYHGTNPSQAYLEGHDLTFGTATAEVEPDPELETPQPQRKVATRKKSGKRKRAPNKAPMKMDTLPCGKVMGTAGRHFHVAKCETCQEAAKE
jgi:hypothetical protein